MITWNPNSNAAHLPLWSSNRESANLFGEMANQNSNQNVADILDKIDRLGEKIGRVEERVSDKIDRIEERVTDKVDEIATQIGGPDGVRERLTTLEVRFEQVIVEHTPAHSYPSPVKIKKSVMKEHGTAVGAGAGVAITSVVYAVVQLISSIVAK